MTGVCSVRKRVYTSLMPSVDLTPDATWIKLVFLFSFVIFASFQSYSAFSMEYSLVFIVLYFSLSPPCLRYARFFFFFETSRIIFHAHFLHTKCLVCVYNRRADHVFIHGPQIEMLRHNQKNKNKNKRILCYIIINVNNRNVRTKLHIENLCGTQ